MTPQAIIDRITQRFGSAVTASFALDRHPRIHTTAEQWRPIAEFLLGDSELALDWLSCLTAVDYVADNKLAVVYDLRSTTKGHVFAVKVYVDRTKPVLDTVSDLWPAADWHEREAYDMMGITFNNHPDPRRILLPDDWEGFPLRKDYVFPRSYQGIPGSYELDWQQVPNYPK